MDTSAYTFYLRNGLLDMGTSDQRVLNGVNLQATTIITPS